MEELLHTFISNLKARSHLNYILPRKELSIGIHTENGRMSLLISNQNITIDPDEKESKVCIKCSHENLNTFIKGQEKLQKMIHSGKVEVTGSYREVLMLESLFLLNRPYEEISNQKSEFS